MAGKSLTEQATGRHDGETANREVAVDSFSFCLRQVSPEPATSSLMFKSVTIKCCCRPVTEGSTTSPTSQSAFLALDRLAF